MMGSRGNWMAFWLALLAGLALAIFATTPPGAKSADTPVEEFSAARAMVDVGQVAARPHPTGSEANAQVRAYLVKRLERMGFNVETRGTTLGDAGAARLNRWSGRDDPAPELTNIIATLPGADRSKPALAFMAHYDSVWDSPGAADDAAGVAAIIETMRALQTDGQPPRDLVVLFTDAEEVGLYGAREIFENDPVADRIGAIINLEARGGGGRTTLFQTSANNGAAVDIYADAVSRPAGSSLAVYIYNVLPNDTDLTPALERDYAAYNLGFIGRPGLYHSPLITPDRLDQGALQDMGDQTVGLARGLLAAEMLPAAAPDRTFFDVFGLFLMTYGAVTAWILLALMVALHVYILRRDAGNGAVLRGLGGTGAVLFGAVFVLYILNVVSGAGGNYYDRLAAIPMLEVQAALVCAGLFAVTAPLWAGRNGSIIGVLIAIVAHIFAPTASYVIVWPLLISGISGALAPHLGKKSGRAVKVVAGALVIGFLLQVGHQLMQGVGPDMPSIAALLAILAVPILGQLIAQVNARKAIILGAILLVLASAVALYVRFDPVADTAASYDGFG